MTHLVQVSIPYFTGFPRDVVTNTWHFNWLGVGTPGSTEYSQLVGQTLAFYEEVFLTSGGVVNLATWTRPDQTRTRVYDLNEPPPRVPVFDALTPLDVATGITGGAPSPEVAICLSYQAAITSGVSK